MHQDRPARIPVAARASDLLVIRLQAPRQRSVDDRADIGLIDSHAEGDGRDHDFDLAGQELFLDPFPMVGIEARVICRRRNPRSELRGQAVGLLPSWRVNNGGPVLVIEQQFTGEFTPLRWPDLDHFNRDIRSPEPVNEPFRLCEPQLFLDIVLNQRCRRGSERNDHDHRPRMHDDVRLLVHGEQSRRLSLFRDVEVGRTIRVRWILQYLGEIQIALRRRCEVRQAAIERGPSPK